MKDLDGRVIGFGKLQYSIPPGEQLAVDFEAVGRYLPSNR